MRNVLPGSEIDEILEPYYSIVKDAIADSFNEILKFKDFMAERGCFVNMKPRSKGSLINDVLNAKLSQALFSDENAKVVECNGVFGVLIKNKIFIRFNKMNAKFKTSVTRTNQYKSFEDGEVRIENFPEEATIVWGGFIPNPAWNKIRGYFLCTTKGRWYFDLKNYKVEQLQLEIEQQPEEKAKNRTSPKKTDEDQQTGSGV